MIEHLLTAVVFFPLLAALTILFTPRGERGLQRSIAIGGAAVTFLLTCLLLFRFDQTATGIQFEEHLDWIASLRIAYLIGVDGLSVTLIALTALVFLLGMVASWDNAAGSKGYFALFLVLETTVLGTFVAQDLFLFFTFWTSSLLPAYSLLSVWGGRGREYAATKFFLFQIAGGALLIIGLFALYYAAEPHSFSLLELSGGKFGAARLEIAGTSFSLENVVFCLLLIGFAIRLPVVPLHTWFPHFQTEAPPALAVVMASVFIKTGAYAILRVNYAVFPQAAQAMAQYLALAGTINIIYGGLCALGQRDVRKLVAYSCISHMGFVLLGLGNFSATSLHGALLQMVSHGIYVGLLFFLVGILGERSGHFNITNKDGTQGFGGLVKRAPLLTGFFTVAVFSALGVPGFGGFASQMLVFLGTFPYHEIFTFIGLGGVFLTAGYFLWMYRRVFLGEARESSERVTDLTLRERIFLVPLVVLSIFVGIYPAPLLHLANPTITRFLTMLEAKK